MHDYLISLKAAIDAVNTALFPKINTAKDAEKALRNLPSAQPELSTEIQEILTYLDTTLHPIVSPDNWNVYAELHDMVSMLPSAQPETDSFCTDCKEYDQERHFCPRFDRVIKKTIEEMKAEQRWIPCSERLPDVAQRVLLSGHGQVMVGMLHSFGKYSLEPTGISYVYPKDDIEAWMPLPEPYTERRGNETD